MDEQQGRGSRGGDGQGDSRDSRSRQGGGRRPAGGGGRRFSGPRRRRKVCMFCVDKVDALDYKDIGVLSRYIARSGRIASRRKSGTCAKHQRMLAKAIKRARHIALLPYTAEHTRQYGG